MSFWGLKLLLLIAVNLPTRQNEGHQFYSEQQGFVLERGITTCVSKTSQLCALQTPENLLNVCTFIQLDIQLCALYNMFSLHHFWGGVLWKPHRPEIAWDGDKGRVDWIQEWLSVVDSGWPIAVAGAHPEIRVQMLPFRISTCELPHRMQHSPCEYFYVSMRGLCGFGM